MKRSKTYKHLKRNVDWLLETKPGNRIIYEFTIPSIVHNEKHLEEINQKFKLTSINRLVESPDERPTQRLLIADNAFTNYRDCDDYITGIVRMLDSIAILPDIYCTAIVSAFPSSEKVLIPSYVIQKVGLSVYFDKEPLLSLEELVKLTGIEFWDLNISQPTSSKLISDSTSKNWELRASYPPSILDGHYTSGNLLEGMEMSAKRCSEVTKVEKRMELVNTKAAL